VRLIKEKALWVVLLSLFLCMDASALTIGPAQTKLERARREPRSGVSSPRGYEGVLKSFLESDFTQSERLAARMLERARPSDPRTDDLSYLRALSLMKLGRFAEARPILKQLEGEAGSSLLRAQAAYSLGDSFYFEQKRAEADVYYREAVFKYPSYGEAGQVKRLIGLSHPRQQSIGGQAAPLQQMGVEETEEGLYSVQVGAFARRRNAERLLNRLLRNRYDAYVLQEEISKNFRVRVGHLSVREDAQTLESNLKKDGYPTRIFP